MPQFRAAKSDGKHLRWGAYEGQYCFYIDNRCVLPPNKFVG